jgi:lysozyme
MTYSTTYSQDCVALVKSFEGCELTGYPDVRGIPTIGYGHTGPSVKIGDVITQEQADAYLALDLDRAADVIQLWTAIPLSQNQFDALTDFQYNTGGFQGSTLHRLLNQGNILGASEQFLVWNKAEIDGQLVVLPDLTRRRAAERALFLGITRPTEKTA